jgi:hypothetical protein
MAGKYQATKVTMHSGVEVTVYASPRVQAALEEVTADLTIYKGVRLAQVLEAVYNQGRKDGARAAFDEVTRGVSAAQKAIPHRAPGRPKKKKR